MNKKNEILPVHLKSTYHMLLSAFPNGIDDTSYFPLLALLDENMSDRNLAKLISVFTRKNWGVVMNDIYKIGYISIDQEKIEKLRKKLLLHGYAKWLQEP